MAGYTPERLELFVALAGERRRRELVELANAMAVGASVGFSGSLKPLEAYERGLLGAVAAAGGALAGELQGRLAEFARSVGAAVPSGAAAREARESARARARERG